MRKSKDELLTTEPQKLTDRQKAQIALERIEFERFRKRSIWTLLLVLFLLPAWFLISMSFSGSFDQWGVRVSGVAFILFFLLPLIWFLIAQMQQRQGAFVAFDHETENGEAVPIVKFIPPERWHEWAGITLEPDPTIAEMDNGIPRPTLYDDDLKTSKDKM